MRNEVEREERERERESEGGLGVLAEPFRIRNHDLNLMQRWIDILGFFFLCVKRNEGTDCLRSRCSCSYLPMDGWTFLR